MNGFDEKEMSHKRRRGTERRTIEVEQRKWKLDIVREKERDDETENERLNLEGGGHIDKSNSKKD